MKRVAATEFKARCLRLIEEVRETGLPLIVTKRGVPIVRILPAPDEAAWDGLEGSVLYQDEDIFSTGEEWEADS
ncbi:MAG: type II toxin-antitoxin system Phd/YefM family antitoxin [Planctomycetota bacterium]